MPPFKKIGESGGDAFLDSSKPEPRTHGPGKRQRFKSEIPTTRVPNAWLAGGALHDLDTTQFVVLLRLYFRAMRRCGWNPDTVWEQTVYVSAAILADGITTERTVQRVLPILIEKQYIQQVQKKAGRICGYRLLVKAKRSAGES